MTLTDRQRVIYRMKRANVAIDKALAHMKLVEDEYRFSKKPQADTVYELAALLVNTQELISKFILERM